MLIKNMYFDIQYYVHRFMERQYRQIVKAYLQFLLR